MDGVLSTGSDLRIRFISGKKMKFKLAGVLVLFLLQFSTRSTAQHTLYFLSMLPYHIPEFPPDYQPSFVDGPSLAPAMYLAVGQINNRSDILGRYKIELIESNGGCNFESETRISFVSHVLYGDKQIVGIIGPTCGRSARALSTLIDRETISLINVDIAPSPLYLDRNYQNTFATTYAEVIAATGGLLTAIVKENHWSRFGIFRHSEDNQRIVQAFLDGISDYAHEITFFGEVTMTNLPVEQVRNSLTRVILAFTNPDTSRRLACLAFHNNITYPTYQWIFHANYTYEETTVVHGDITYTCSGDQLKLEGSINIDCKLTPNEPYTPTVSGLNYFEYLDAYTTYSEWYNDEYGYNETVAAWANPCSV